MAPLTTTATFQRLLVELAKCEEGLSATERAALHYLLPPHLTDLAFLFAAPEEILTPAELAIFERLRAEKSNPNEPCAVRPQTVVIMKATRLCNLRCTYCHAWKEGPNQVMTFAVLAKATRDVLRSEAKRVTFVWHGGEVTILPISFFKKALWLQRMFGREGQSVSNVIQTNATRLNDDWITLFKAGNFKVGVSIDGPREIHDSRRLTKTGQPTWEKVQLGITRLREAKLGWGALVVVDHEVARLGAKALLDCIVQLGISDVALLNVIPDNLGHEANGPDYLPWPAYVEFLCGVFRWWWPHYRDKVKVRELEALINNLSGYPPNTCVLAGNCMGQYLTVEPAGGISACDKYIGDRKFEFGNILHSDLNTLLGKSRNLARARRDANQEVTQMTDCKYLRVCRGGCPHDRRLNRLHQPALGEGCCGLSPLLDEISAALSTMPPEQRS
jgi:uncharacterized protein